MKKSQILVFLLILIADIIVVSLGFETGEFIFKPLICIWLMACFVLQTREIQSDLKRWLLAGLLLSWMGDVLLIFAGYDAIYFLLGLSAFLIAHIFYILLFHFIRLKENIKSRWWLVLPVVVYYGFIISLLGPSLGDMRLPVRVYGIIISFMLMLGSHMIYSTKKVAGYFIFSGALLFVISDSILAINKFYQSFELAGLLIMLTYGLAQLFITVGVIRYLSSTYKG
jgi:uncharacterized membrane protein YhhN